MSEQYDPEGVYDVIEPEGSKTGELRQGRYFETTWEVGKVEGDVFHYNGKPAGKLEGLTLTRDDPPGAKLTQFKLVRQK